MNVHDNNLTSNYYVKQVKFEMKAMSKKHKYLFLRMEIVLDELILSLQ